MARSFFYWFVFVLGLVQGGCPATPAPQSPDMARSAGPPVDASTCGTDCPTCPQGSRCLGKGGGFPYGPQCLPACSDGRDCAPGVHCVQFAADNTLAVCVNDTQPVACGGGVGCGNRTQGPTTSCRDQSTLVMAFLPKTVDDCGLEFVFCANGCESIFITPALMSSLEQLTQG